MTIKASPDFYDYIKTEEGYSAKEYDDRGAGSVGYGIRGTGKKFVTPAEAEKDFLNRIMVAETELAQVITRPNLTQMQQNALVDKHFNMGLTKMREQGFIDLINNGTDEQIAESLKKAVNSRHSQTGVVEKIDALVPRASNRSSMWLGTYGQDNTGADLDLSVLDEEELDLSVLDEEDELDLSVLDEVSTPVSTESRLATSLNSFTEGEDEVEKNAQKLSKEFNQPVEVMRAELVDSSYDDVRVKLKTPDIVAGSPKVAEFAARNPDNGVLLKKTKDYLPKVEAAAKNLNKTQMGMVEKVARTNVALLSKGMTQLGMVLGAYSVPEGIEQLKKLDVDQADSAINTPEMIEIQRAMEQMNPVMIKTLKDATSAWDSSKTAVENILPALAAVYDNTPEFSQALWNVVMTLGSNPGNAVALVAQTQLPMLAGAATGITAGPIAGAATASSLSGLLSFNEYMSRQLEPFKDPESGEIRYDIAFSDPARVSQWRKEAALYSGVMAAADGLFQLSGGFFKKHITGGAVGKAVKGAAAETATGAVTEGGSQFLALQATDIYGDRVTTESTAKNLAEGLTEGIVGMLAAGSISSAKTGFDLLSHGVKKTSSKVKEANTANEDAVATSQLREKVKEDEAYQTNPDQVDELINDVLNPEEQTFTVNEEGEVSTSAVEQELEAEASNNVVAISPSEFEAFAEKKGIDPLEAIGAFSPKTQAEYGRNRMSDTSISVSVAEYLRATEEMPELDGLVRFNGNDLNALEANEQLEELERNPFALFDTENLPPVPVPETETETEIESEPEVQTVEDPETSSILRPITLQHQFRSLDEREVFNSLRNKLNRATFKDTVDEKALDLITDLQFRHIRARADFLGVPVKEIAEGTVYKKAEGSARGAFIPASLDKAFHTVAFTKHADAKTVVHELSHAWLYEMAEDFVPMSRIPEDQRTFAQNEYFKAMKDTASLIGVENLNEILSLPESQQRRIQEIFANTAEKYFQEGNFESSKFRHIFETLRKWIIAAARPLKNLVRTYPTLKLDGRFEFVIDTILGGVDKVDDIMYPMFEDPMFTEADLGKELFKIYQDKVMTARAQAQVEAYAKTNNVSMREREKALDAAFNIMYQQAVNTVEEMPSQILARDFENNWKNRQQGQEETRLSFESVRDVLARGSEEDAETIKKNVPTFMMTGKKKGGFDVGVLMQLLDINDPALMLDMLLETGRKEQLIEAEMSKLVKEFDPGLKTDAELHDIAVKAVNGKGREKLILDEFDILATKDPAAIRKIGAALISPASVTTEERAKDLKVRGSVLAGNANAYKFSPSKFLNDMMRSRRRSASYFKRGDTEQAMVHKLQEGLHYFALKEAEKLKPRLATALGRIGKIVKDATNQVKMSHYDLEAMKFGVNTIINVRNGNAQGITPLDINDIDAYSALGEDGVSAINAALENFVNISKGRIGDAISVEGMIALGDFARTVMRQAREAKSIDIAGLKADVQAAADSFGTEVGEGNTIQTFNPERSGILERKYFSKTVNVRSLFEGMYKSKEAFINGVVSPFLEVLSVAEQTRDADVTKYVNMVTESLKKVAKNDTKLQALFAPIINRTPWRAAIDKTARPIASKELNFTFNNISEVLTAMLIRGSESGARKLIVGRKWGDINQFGELDSSKFDSFVERAISEGIITIEHINFLNTVWDLMREIYPSVKETLLKVDGIDIGEVEALPIKTSIGTLKGGYFPITSVKKMMQSSSTDFIELLSADTLYTDAHKLYPIQNKDFAKTRNESTYEVALDLSKIVPYIGATMNIVHLRKPLKDFGKFLNNQTTRDVMEARRPGALDTVVRPWFERVLRQEYTEYSDGPIDAAARFLRTRANIPMYFGAITSGVRQYFGFAPAAVLLGAGAPKYLSGAAVKFGLNPVKLMREIEQKSAYMKGRREGNQKKFMRSFEQMAQNFDWLTTSQEWSQNAAFSIIQFNQNNVDAMVWTAAFDKAIKTMGEDRAIAYADNIVKSSQSDASVSEMAEVLAGSDVHKLFTAVSTVVVAQHNMLRVETMRDQSTQKKFIAASSISLIGLVFTSYLDALMSEAVFPVPEEEEEKDPEGVEAERMKRIMLRGFGSVVESAFPIYGRMAIGLVGNDMLTISPVIARTQKALEGSSKALTAAKKGKELTPYEFSALMDFFSFASGLPFSKLGDLNKLEYDNLEPWERRAIKRQRSTQERIYQSENR